MWLLGCGAFLLFFTGDFFELRERRVWGRACFFAGLAALCAAVALQALNSLSVPRPLWLRLICGAAAVGFLLLLIHALFFALPFGATYGAGEKPGVVASGVYALCRHPGVLWLWGVLFSLCGATGFSVRAALLYALLDLGYAFFQDRVSFPRTLDGYTDYRRTAPFLIPTPESVRRCLSSLS